LGFGVGVGVEDGVLQTNEVNALQLQQTQNVASSQIHISSPFSFALKKRVWVCVYIYRKAETCKLHKRAKFSFMKLPRLPLW